MAFGPIMQVPISNELLVELAPLAKTDMPAFVSPGMQSALVTQYLQHRNANVLEDEEEWFERARVETNSIVWGIFVVESNGTRKLIGDTALTDIERKHIHQAISGSMLFDRSYWGKGIASRIHMARTWYAFQHRGFHRIKSAVIHGNVASLKALQKSGYEMVYVERNVTFVDGRLRHQDNLECINPNEPFWSQWWHQDEPDKRHVAARERTLRAMDWAKDNVTLI